MNIVLYNPLSKRGSKNKGLKKIKKILDKKKEPYDMVDITSINNIADFLLLHRRASSYIILGGDGTLNILANNIQGYDIKQDIYLFKSGTGNDFIRSLPKQKGLIKINDYLINLPKVIIGDEERLFLNGAGLGLDGLIANKVNYSKFRKNKFNYFRHTIEGFTEYKAASAELTLNDEVIEIEKAWLVSVMNDKFLGGGMKIAPDADRTSEYLDVVIVKKAPKILLLFIFPIIYLGIHKHLKKYVEIIKTKQVKIKFKGQMFLQVDGEIYENITEVEMIK